MTGDVICCYMAYINPSPLILHSTTATQVSVAKKDGLIHHFYFLLKLIHHLFLIERALYTRHSPIRFGRHDTCKNFWSIIGRTGWENSRGGPWQKGKSGPLLTRHAVHKHRKALSSHGTQCANTGKVCRTSTQHYRSLNLRWRQTSCRGSISRPPFASNEGSPATLTLRT